MICEQGGGGIPPSMISFFGGLSAQRSVMHVDADNTLPQSVQFATTVFFFQVGKNVSGPSPPPPPPGAERPFSGLAAHVFRTADAALWHFATRNQIPWRRPRPGPCMNKMIIISSEVMNFMIDHDSLIYDFVHCLDVWMFPTLNTSLYEHT